MRRWRNTIGDIVDLVASRHWRSNKPDEQQLQIIGAAFDQKVRAIPGVIAMA